MKHLIYFSPHAYKRYQEMTNGVGTYEEVSLDIRDQLVGRMPIGRKKEHGKSSSLVFVVDAAGSHYYAVVARNNAEHPQLFVVRTILYRLPRGMSLNDLAKFSWDSFAEQCRNVVIKRRRKRAERRAARKVSVG